MVKILKRGFTLIELLVVIGIMAVIAGAVLVLIDPVDKIRQANDAKVQADVAQIATALGTYAANNNGYFPTAAQGLTQLVTAGELAKVPTAPVGYTSGYAYVVLPSGCTATTCIQAGVSADLKSKKYTTLPVPVTPFWTWCSTSAGAAPETALLTSGNFASGGCP